MNSRERILKALNCEKPDRVPIAEIYINKPIIVAMAKRLFNDSLDIEVAEEDYQENEKISNLFCRLTEDLGIDATFSDISIGMEKIDENTARDKFGVLYKLSEQGEPVVVSGSINSLDDLNGFNMVSKLKETDFNSLKYKVEKLGEGKAHFINIVDPFKISWRLRGGMQNLLLDYALQPKLALSLAQVATDYCLAAIEIASEIGADVVVLQGDLAGSETTFMSPAHYKELLKPFQKAITDFTHQKGLKLLKHTDGNIWTLIDDFIEIGFDGIHPIQPQCMDIKKVKEYVAGKLCIMGNIDCEELLPFGSIDEVNKSVKDTIELVASDGGYIISSSNSIHPRVNPENYIAMIKAAKKYGSY